MNVKINDEIIIRNIVEQDYTSFVAFEYKILKNGDGQILTLVEFQCNFQEYLKKIKNAQLFLIVENNHKIIGKLCFKSPQQKRRSHVGEFEIALLPQYRSKGIGSKLLNHLMQWAKNQSKIEKINLTVLSDNQKAINLYKKFGFIEEGRKIKEIKISDSNYQDAIQMGLFIKKGN